MFAQALAFLLFQDLRFDLRFGVWGFKILVWDSISFKIWDLAWIFESPVKKIWDYRVRFYLIFAHHCSGLNIRKNVPNAGIIRSDLRVRPKIHSVIKDNIIYYDSFVSSLHCLLQNNQQTSSWSITLMVVVGHSWHANRRTSGQLSFEGSWILLLNNNSRELVPITDCSDSKWVIFYQ